MARNRRRRSSLVAYAWRGYGKHTAKAWEFWPQLMWLNIATAVSMAFAMFAIVYASPESAPAVIPSLSMSTIIVVLGIASGITYRRRMRKESQDGPGTGTPQADR